ncbi:hypothetical protein DYBT9275_05910 [Dyadobacter sp. CECT 9275]|uniref:Viral A-type inclusion protein n=1 Tax=Dyadobacter helix TaxID=2822344 RepID=A0A916JIN3_9BACT|nr:hypothetical protein [Dyadobacter sp. CECT 9275]CAG5018059.1 hypothetical protein DYBT9275_05910 [Dyadobacter sp. CECT 9275]
MKKYLIGLTLITLFIACQSEHKEEHSTHESHEDTSHAGHRNPQEQELMAIHDSIMPRMGEMMDLQQQLKSHIKMMDSLLTLKADPQYKSQMLQAQVLVGQLEAADKSMMDWMHQYKADTLEKLDVSMGEKYLAEQKSSIQAVRGQMRRSMAASENFVKKYIKQ